MGIFDRLKKKKDDMVGDPFSGDQALGAGDPYQSQFPDMGQPMQMPDQQGFQPYSYPQQQDASSQGFSPEAAGFDRILLGSDFPLLKPSRYVKEMAESGLSEEQIRKISFSNAASLLGL